MHIFRAVPECFTERITQRSNYAPSIITLLLSGKKELYRVSSISFSRVMVATNLLDSIAVSPNLMLDK